MLDRSQMETIKRGDIFWTDLEVGIGSEQGGIRPVIIVQNPIGNKYSPTVVVCAVTSQINKAKLPTHVEVGEECSLRPSIILGEVMRTIDKKRLNGFICKAPKNIMDKVNKALLNSLAIGEGEYMYLSSQEKVATCKAKLVYQSESVLKEMIQENESFILIDKYTQKRMKRLNELESYCKLNDLDYRRFYTTVTDTRQRQSK